MLCYLTLTRLGILKAVFSGVGVNLTPRPYIKKNQSNTNET